MRSIFRMTLLGIGVPIPAAERFGPATLMEAGNQTVVIDAGRGATIRLFQIGVPIGRIDALLLTHFHSDHTVARISDHISEGKVFACYYTIDLDSRLLAHRRCGAGAANELI